MPVSALASHTLGVSRGITTSYTSRYEGSKTIVAGT